MADDLLAEAEEEIRLWGPTSPLSGLLTRLVERVRESEALAESRLHGERNAQEKGRAEYAARSEAESILADVDADRQRLRRDLASLRTRLEEAERDAARWRHLVDHPDSMPKYPMPVLCWWDDDQSRYREHDDIEAAGRVIDAARTPEGGTDG